jgi:NAD(P)-dependent dehydrogenase (short-subunit alcohol dehydrogenase family)
VRQLSQSDSNTIIAAVRTLQGDMADLKDLASKAAGKVHIAECNTGDFGSIHKFAGELKNLLGSNGKIDYLLNNAGINATPEQSSLDISPESMHNHININVLGPAETLKVLLPFLTQGSVVLNMTSGLGSLGKKLYVLHVLSLSDLIENGKCLVLSSMPSNRALTSSQAQ